MATCTSHLLIHSYSLRFNPASLLGGIKYLCSPNNTNKIGPQLGTVFLRRLGTSLFSSCPLVLVSSSLRSLRPRPFVSSSYLSSSPILCLLVHILSSLSLLSFSFPYLFVKYLFKLSVYLVFLSFSYSFHF